MKNLSDVVLFSEFLQNIAQWERHVEFTRQFLNGLSHFEPYSAFKYICKSENRLMTSQDLKDFLKSSKSVTSEYCPTLLCLHDADNDNELNFEEF